MSPAAEKCHGGFGVFTNEKLFRSNRIETFLLPPTDGTQYPPMSHYGL